MNKKYTFITEVRERRNVSNNGRYIRDYQIQESLWCRARKTEHNSEQP